MANTLNVSQALKMPGHFFPFSTRVEVESADVFGETVRFSPAELTGTLLGAGETVTVRGNLRCVATMACARCLSPVSVPLSVEVDERFSRHPEADDEEMRVIEEGRVDLTDCVLDGIAVSDTNAELRGAIVTMEQAAMLAKRLGIVIKA